VKVIPSTKPESTTPGAGNIAKSGEIELHGRDLIFVTNVPFGSPGSSIMRVNLQSGGIGRATGVAPAEIYSEWSLVRTDGNLTQTLYEHKQPRPVQDSRRS
jgi:hypothetical protein